jgi:hypothetical protein
LRNIWEVSISYKQLFPRILCSSKRKKIFSSCEIWRRTRRRKMNFIWSYFLNGKLIKRWNEEGKSFAFSIELCFSPSLTHSLNSNRQSFARKQFFFPHTLVVVYLECKYMIYHFATTFFFLLVNKSKLLGWEEEVKNNSWKQNQGNCLASLRHEENVLPQIFMKSR